MSTNAVPPRRAPGARGAPPGADCSVASDLADKVWSTSARADRAAPIRHRVTAYARDRGMPEARVSDLALAVSEAIANAVIHAYRDAPMGTMEVTAGVRDGSLSVAVRDWGSGLVPRRDSPGLGLGLPLISQLADTLQVDEPAGGGTQLRMTFALRLRSLT